MEYTQTVPSRYKGKFPMIAIRDQFETYCAPLGEKTADEVLADFRTTYDWNCDLDLSAEEIAACESQDPVSAYDVYESAEAVANG